MEYIYYSEGFLYIENEREKSIQEVVTTGFKEMFNLFEHLFYETADLKTILFDISSCVRGLGGVKKSFDPKDLPSVQKDRKEQAEREAKERENETPEERLERQKKFFEMLRNTFNNK